MKETEKFSDESDRATYIESAAIDFGIQQAALKANIQEFEPTGFCLNCNEKLEEGRRFCDKDCMDDFQKRTKK